MKTQKWPFKKLALASWRKQQKLFLETKERHGLQQLEKTEKLGVYF